MTTGIHLERARQARPLILGILNVTPDSFSDGGSFVGPDAAVAHAVSMVEAGADVIDVGGESTRPGAERLPVGEEQDRIMPVIRELVDRGIRVSVDTMNAATAAVAVEAGVTIINDVSGGLADRGMRRVAAESGCDYIAMHWRGHSTEMDSLAVYTDVVRAVRDELKQRVAELIVVGMDPERIILDPGLGFAKRHQHNWQLLGRLRELETLGHRILVGASRKRFLGALLPEDAGMDERDAPTATISALAAENGAWAVRVHDVPATAAALRVWQLWNDGRSSEPLALEAASPAGSAGSVPGPVRSHGGAAGKAAKQSEGRVGAGEPATARSSREEGEPAEEAAEEVAPPRRRQSYRAPVAEGAPAESGSAEAREENG